MQPKNKGRKRILRTNASVSGPIKVRNLKTGELAIYTPDRLQPTIPAGWVPLNSSRQQSRTASHSFRRNSGLVVQTCGNQYRILNSSRQVVARGKLNASKETYAVTTVSYTNPEGPAKDHFAHSAEEAYRMVEDYFRDVRESGLIDDEILNIRLRELAAESAANPNDYGVGEDSESPTGYDVLVQRIGDPLDSSRRTVARGSLNAWRHPDADVDDDEYWRNGWFDPERPDLTANPDEMPPDMAADVRAYRDVDDYFRKYDYPDDYDRTRPETMPVYHGPHSEYEGMQDHEAEMYFLNKHPEFIAQPDDWGEPDDEETDYYEATERDEDF